MISNNMGLVVSCIDHSLKDETIELLKKESLIDGFDHVKLAGASVGFNQTDYVDWKIVFIQHIDLGIKLRDIKQIIVIDHEDCDIYKLFYTDIIEHPYLERGYHYKNIRQFLKKISELYPDIQVIGYMLNINNRLIKIN